MDAKMKELLIDYIDGNLTGELQEFVQKQISKNEEVRQEYSQLKEISELMGSDIELEPDSTLQSDFLLAIEEELERIKEVPGNVDKTLDSGKARVIGLSIPWKVAAAIAFVVTGFFAGKWVFQQSTENQELMALKKEMEETKGLVIASLENKTSASTRLYGVNVAYKAESADSEIIRVLVKAMNEDENVNVRLAAVQALARFSDEPGVMNALIHALEVQKEALVQIALINLMVELKEQRALDKLEQIIHDAGTLEAVRDEAHMAVFKLS